MKVIRDSNNIEKNTPYPVVAMGNFDGVHKGHQKILKKIINVAKQNYGTSVLYTFTPHPVKVLSPNLAPLLIQTEEQKINTLSDIGLDQLIIEPFNEALAKLGSKDFFEKIICSKIKAKEVIIGYDFTFGQKRSGKVEDLEKLAKSAHIKVTVVDAIMLKGAILSSTSVRHFVSTGDIASANSMLGRPFEITGKVIKGRGIGAELGYNTANLKSDNELLPPPGVYITATTIEGNNNTSYGSITNIGYNPTFGGTQLSIETHLLDFSELLIGKNIALRFYKKIREEMVFNSIKELKRQISKDIIKARGYHEKHQ